MESQTTTRPSEEDTMSRPMEQQNAALAFNRLDEITSCEGSHVTLLQESGPDGSRDWVVEVLAEFTGWTAKRFKASSVYDAIALAEADRQAWIKAMTDDGEESPSDLLDDDGEDDERDNDEDEEFDDDNEDDFEEDDDDDDDSVVDDEDDDE